MRSSLVFILALLTAACGSGSSSPGGAGGAAGSDGGQVGPDAAADVLPADSSADSSAGTSDACAAYIACTAETTPAGLDTLLVTYGEDGSCWAAGDPDLCEKACRAGLVSAHMAFPTVEACNVCWTSTDCPPAQPACDTTANRCVGCVSDLDCGHADRPACETSSHTCVACTSQTHCSGAAPVCDPAAHQCVRCLDNSDCYGDTPVCDPTAKQCFECLSDDDCANSTKGQKCDVVFTHQCGCGLFGDCGAGRLCEQGTCCTPDCGSAVCGPSNTIGCGSDNPYACGVCPNNGTCYQGACSDLGKECTPATSQCYDGEACFFNSEAQSYTCLTDVAGEDCNNVYSCNVAAHGSGTYVCPAGKCRPHCLSATECASGICESWGAPVSPSTPGVCTLP
jgi:hypothetical protein